MTKNSHSYEFELLKVTKPRLSFDGAIPLNEWKIDARVKLTALLGLPLGVAKTEKDNEALASWHHRAMALHSPQGKNALRTSF